MANEWTDGMGVCILELEPTHILHKARKVFLLSATMFSEDLAQVYDFSRQWGRD